ncbi:MAG: hypothetical protein B7Y25_08230 [Alphaproteobacteria bacterium 16-39-46]|nr:MAG: hypothetical protein B7Y25_08230 [Alphaproteobacteria bacterium 16-39-46]OZA41230.1 MAG: hypothetical protein B7X84_08360 [Alphaproteobacteria bacterium 17-39-52]HQS84867.1 tetratricopeptide repeat protein [Alphaproteobacteria bacterium]HQS94645.1 tetratricopeptide repeat protein [Alphaproteobacteria bacterium]
MRLSVFLVWVFLFLSFAELSDAASLKNDVATEELLDSVDSEAKIRLEKGDISGAIQIFEDFLKKYPDSFEALTFLAGIYGLKEDFQREKELCEKAIKINSKHADAYLNLGNVYVGFQDWPKAKENLLKAYEFAKEQKNIPVLRTSSYNLSSFFLVSGESNDLAIKWADQCIAYLPDSFMRGEGLPRGVLGEFRDDNKRLIWIYESAIMNKAGAYANKKNYKKSISILENYLKIYPHSSDVKDMLDWVKKKI